MHTLLILLIGLAMISFTTIEATDPDILSDFIVPENLTSIDGKSFTFTRMRKVFEGNPESFQVTKAGVKEFPALEGQSVSFAVLQYPPAGINPTHTHPRSAELLFLVYGCLQVGFVDSKNVLYTQNLTMGDMFVFPKGLVHFQYNPHNNSPAIALSAFGSANAGTVSVPATLFATGIDDEVHQIVQD
ncbi:putative germin-like protein 9-2 [Carica papaya]|uniref:putative germin-like protein 9-2 n=1 Tax=Carica papaya TaxID=3649 RepID=UPI000B8C9215|nr:putative germin-like protein 9-2 [Carica papaya]